MKRISVWIRWQLNKCRKWWKSVTHKKPAPQTIVVPLLPDGEYDYSFKRTKAYADQRQKAMRNRRKKPTKAMRNVYHLK